MKIGYTNGCFDLFHAGHEFFLDQCYNFCDYLIVAVNSDESVRFLKGQDRPVHNIHTRMHNMQWHADAVIPFDGNVSKLISLIQPDIVILGHDQYWAEAATAKQITTIEKLAGYSTTLQIELQKAKTTV